MSQNFLSMKNVRVDQNMQAIYIYIYIKFSKSNISSLLCELFSLIMGSSCHNFIHNFFFYQGMSQNFLNMQNVSPCGSKFNIQAKYIQFNKSVNSLYARTEPSIENALLGKLYVFFKCSFPGFIVCHVSKPGYYFHFHF